MGSNMKKMFTAILLSLLMATTAFAAKAPPAECSWSPNAIAAGQASVMNATGLPTNDTIAFTWEPYPIGTTLRTDGTYSITWTFSSAGNYTLYIWQRGGGKSLIKAGPQLNDYRVIAICSITVI